MPGHLISAASSKPASAYCRSLISDRLAVAGPRAPRPMANVDSKVLRKTDFGPAGFRWLTLSRIEVRFRYQDH